MAAVTAVDERPAVADLGDPWAITTATEILSADAAREAWLEVRREGIGASDVSSLLGMTQYGSAISLWLDKTGRWVDETDSNDAAWGRRLEPVIADWFTEETGIETRRCGLLRSLAHPVMQATPDRLVPHGGLEIKTLQHHTEHEWDDGQIPDHAELQSQWCMAVSGRSHWWVVGLVNGRRPHLRLVQRDDDLIANLIAEAERWWPAYVGADEMPPMDDSPATLEAITGWVGDADPRRIIPATGELLDLYAELEKAKNDVKLAEAIKTGIESRVRLLIGDASVVAIDPDKPIDDTAAGRDNILIRIDNDGPFNAKRFAEAHPQLVAEFTRDFPKLDAAAIQAAHPDLHRATRARVIRPRKKNLAAVLAAHLAAAEASATPPGSK